MGDIGKGKRVPYVSVVRCPKSGKAGWIILSRHIVCRPIHFVENRSQGCWEPFGQTCPHCRNSARRTDAWYALAQADKSSPVVLLEISDGAWRFCDELQAIEKDARGKFVTLERMGSQKSSVHAEVDPRRLDGKTLISPEFDTDDVARNLWRVPSNRPSGNAVSDGYRYDEVPFPDDYDPPVSSAQKQSSQPQRSGSSPHDATSDFRKIMDGLLDHRDGRGPL